MGLRETEKKKKKPTVLQPIISKGTEEIEIHGHRNPKGSLPSSLERVRTGLINRLKTTFSDK